KSNTTCSRTRGTTSASAPTSCGPTASSPASCSGISASPRGEDHPVTADEARARARELAHLNAFISLTEEQGEGPAVAVKDLVDVRGTATTGGGILLPPTPAARDAPVVERMRRHGVVVMGKANLHEWAFGATSNNPHYGPVRNPHDRERVAGGSSGGSAVAVAT